MKEIVCKNLRTKDLKPTLWSIIYNRIHIPYTLKDRRSLLPCITFFIVYSQKPTELNKKPIHCYLDILKKESNHIYNGYFILTILY